MSRQEQARRLDAEDAQAAEDDAILKASRRSLRELTAAVRAPGRLSEALDTLADAPSALPSPGPWHDGPPRR